MKKIFALFLALIMMLSLCACGSTPDEHPVKETGVATKPATTTPKETEPITFNIGDTAVFSNLKITANEIQESAGEEFFTPDEGNVFVGIQFTIENISNEPQAVSSLMMFETYLNDIKCDYSIAAACVFDEGTLDGEIASGKKLVGWYSVEVPANWESLEVIFNNDILSNNSAKFIFTK